MGRLLQGVGGGGDGRGADAVGRHVRGAVGRAVILRVLALREAGIRGILLGGRKRNRSNWHVFGFILQTSKPPQKLCYLCAQQVTARGYFTGELHCIHLGNYISASHKYTPILLG